MPDYKFQTLRDFIAEPFNRGPANIPNEWKTSAEKLIYQRKIKLMQILEYENSYFYNIEVPSESNPELHYDVVFQFIPQDGTASRKDNVRNYYVKFFSNSPSFVYKYAGLFAAYGFLITSLADKLGKGIYEIPEKTNPDMKLEYDKSIYLAAMLLIKHEYFYGFKDSFMIKRTKDLNAFVTGVMEFDTVMTNIEVANLEKNTKAAIKNDIKKSKTQTIKEDAKRPRHQSTSGIKVVTSNNKKIATNSTTKSAKALSKIIKHQNKITAKKSTRKF